MSFTPGPWTSASAYSSVVGIPIVGPNGERIANASMPGLPAEYDEIKRQHLINARLLAAAPDLFNALRAMLDTHGKPHRDEWMNDAAFEHAKRVDTQARAALSKAEGHIGQELAPDPERRVNGNANGDEV